MQPKKNKEKSVEIVENNKIHKNVFSARFMQF